MAALTGSPYGALGRWPLTPLRVGGFNTLLKPTPARMEVRAHISRATAATDCRRLQTISCAVRPECWFCKYVNQISLERGRDENSHLQYVAIAVRFTLSVTAAKVAGHTFSKKKTSVT